MIEQLYNDLMALCKDNDSFYFADRIVGGDTFRVFNYRLTSWSDMQKPNAKNCRGTTFRIAPSGFAELVSFPPEKFFNYEEGDIDHKQNNIGVVMTKLDGSLISTVAVDTVADPEYFILKSKTSFESEQVIAASKWLDAPEQQQFKEFLSKLNALGYTVNMEWTSPENRIVVPYQESKLTILNIRDMMVQFNNFGDTYYGDRLEMHLSRSGFFYKKEWFVNFECDYTNQRDHSRIDAMKEEQDGEGYVVEIRSVTGSYLVKVKNYKYITLHNTKDSVNTPTKLFAAIINESSDDLRGMFKDDQYSLDKITEMENKIIPEYNHIIYLVEKFHQMYKDVDRKTYAITAKAQYPQLMSLCMNLYLSKTNDYKEFAIKHMTDIFGVSNVVKQEAD